MKVKVYSESETHAKTKIIPEKKVLTLNGRSDGEKKVREVLKQLFPAYYSPEMVLWNNFFHMGEAHFKQFLTNDKIVHGIIFKFHSRNYDINKWKGKKKINSLVIKSSLASYTKTEKFNEKPHKFWYDKNFGRILFYHPGAMSEPDGNQCIESVLESLLRDIPISKATKLPDTKKVFDYDSISGGHVEVVLFNPTQERVKKAVQDYKEINVWIKENKKTIHSAVNLLYCMKYLESKKSLTRRNHHLAIINPLSTAIESLYGEAEKIIKPLRKPENQMPKGNILEHSFG